MAKMDLQFHKEIFPPRNNNFHSHISPTIHYSAGHNIFSSVLTIMQDITMYMTTQLVRRMKDKATQHSTTSTKVVNFQRKN